MSKGRIYVTKRSLLSKIRFAELKMISNKFMRTADIYADIEDVSLNNSNSPDKNGCSTTAIFSS